MEMDVGTGMEMGMGMAMGIGWDGNRDGMEMR